MIVAIKKFNIKEYYFLQLIFLINLYDSLSKVNNILNLFPLEIFTLASFCAFFFRQMV
jgi:hypothetical protein